MEFLTAIYEAILNIIKMIQDFVKSMRDLGDEE